jgi:hypothetical protein
MTEISKRKVPPAGGPSASQMTFEGTALGLGAARPCSLLRPSRAHRSLAAFPPPGGLTGKLNNLNRGGRACRAHAQRKRAH